MSACRESSAWLVYTCSKKSMRWPSPRVTYAFFQSGRLPERAAHPTRLAENVGRPHLDDLHLEELLDRALDLDLVRIGPNLKHDLIADLVDVGALLRDERGLDDRVFAPHAATRSLMRSSAAARDHQVVVAQHVVHVQTRGPQHLGVGNVSSGELDAYVRVVDHDQHAVVDPERPEHRDEVLRLRLAELDAVHDREALLAELLRERGAKRGSPRLFRHAVRVVARVRSEDDGAAGPQRRARAAGAGAAGTLLLPGLLTAAAHVAALLRRRRTGTATGHLHADDVREKPPTQGLVEDDTRELDGPGIRLPLRDDGRVDRCRRFVVGHHSAPAALGLAAPPACFRITIVPPRAPGTAPRRKIRS